MDNFDYPAIGQRIKQLRKRKGLNQTELAQMLKKSLRTVQKYETGEIEVSIAVVNQIADLLDTTSTYILGYESSTTQIRTLADVMDFLFKLETVGGIDFKCLCTSENIRRKRLYSKEDGCFQSNSNLVRKVITLSNKV